MLYYFKGTASDSHFTKECLGALNSCRSIHSVPSLKYNRDIERVAQEWADHLARTNGFSHNPNANYKGQNLGENIASRWSSNREDYPGKRMQQLEVFCIQQIMTLAKRLGVTMLS